MTVPSSYKAYLASVKLRDYVFSYVARPLAALHVQPNFVSFFGVALAVAFFLVIPVQTKLALLLLGSALLCDATDGALSRYKKTCSDRGKFVDVTCDNVVFALFIIGLVSAGILNALTALVFLFVTTLSKIFRIIWNSKYFESDWKFKPVAGLVPNFFGYSSYGLFALFALSSLNFFNQLLPLFSLILISDAAVFFYLIVTKL